MSVETQKQGTQKQPKATTTTLVTPVIKRVPLAPKSKQDALRDLSQQSQLVGPILMTYLTSKDRKIYLVGDRHVLQTQCEPPGTDYTIMQWLQDMFMAYGSEQTPIDFFFETEFVSGSGKTPQMVERVRAQREESQMASFLDFIQDTFRDCLQVSKEGCLVGKVARLHYIDPRTSFSELIALDKVGDLEAANCDELPYLCMETLQVFYSTMKELSNENNRMSFMSKLVNVAKIQKQLDNIREQAIRDKLKNLIDAALGKEMKVFDDSDKIASTLNFIQEFSQVVAKKDGEEIRLWLEANRFGQDFEAFNKFRTAIFEMLAVSVDAYTTARMLRSYSDGTTATRIVYFAGAAHVRQSIEWLKELGFQEQRQIQSDVRRGDVSNQCVSLAGFYPYFQ